MTQIVGGAQLNLEVACERDDHATGVKKEY